MEDPTVMETEVKGKKTAPLPSGIAELMEEAVKPQNHLLIVTLNNGTVYTARFSDRDTAVSMFQVTTMSGLCIRKGPKRTIFFPPHCIARVLWTGDDVDIGMEMEVTPGRKNR